jgi:hypothetical protein
VLLRNATCLRSDPYDKGNSCPHLGHLAIPHCTEEGHPEHAKALPYVMLKVKPHLGHLTIDFGCVFIHVTFHNQPSIGILKTFLEEFRVFIRKF